MKQVICPLDGKPCEADCPDRYIDQEQGGCQLTTARELGAEIIDLGGENVGIVFLPKSQMFGNLAKKTAPSAANTESGEGGKQTLTGLDSASSIAEEGGFVK